jgi:hypothetical protein
MTKRVCFDIACSLFHDQRHGWIEGPNVARRYFADQKCRFDYATAFDDSIHQYVDISDCQELFEYLSKADELITFSGRIYDLVGLEQIVGEESTKALWGKPHHDLNGWRGYFSLQGAVREFLPNDLSRYDLIKAKRREELMNAGRGERDSSTLGGTHRDVFFTYNLFLKYMESGDTDRTFNDLTIIQPLDQL